MTASLIWISGASGGIGRTLADTVPWDDARVIGISRMWGLLDRGLENSSVVDVRDLVGE